MPLTVLHVIQAPSAWLNSCMNVVHSLKGLISPANHRMRTASR